MPSATRPQRPLRWSARGLADRLDRQPLDLQPRAVAADPRGARDRRRSGCRGRSATSRRRWSRARPGGPVCGFHTRCWAAVDWRANSGRISTPVRSRPSSASAVSRISRSPDRNTRMSPGRSRSSSSTASPIASVWSVSSSRRRGSAPRPGTCGRTPRRSARRRSARRSARGRSSRYVTITFRSGRRGQDPLQVAEQEVDVQAPLVRLVDDDRVVAAQQPVVLDLGQQQAVGHQPQQRVLATSWSLNRTAYPTASPSDTFSSSAIRSATVRAASRRGCVCAIAPAHAAAELEAHLRAAASSCPSRSRRRRSRPGCRGSRPAGPRGAR